MEEQDNYKMPYWVLLNWKPAFLICSALKAPSVHPF